MSENKKKKSNAKAVDLTQELKVLPGYKTQTRASDMKWHDRQVYEKAAKAILKALNLKDQYTFGHSLRVAYFSVITGKELGLDQNDLYDLELAAMFHDIGKIGIPEHVLNKPARLEEHEFQIMKKHPEMSFDILESLDAFHNVAIYAKHHHERFDGRGYPHRLKGEDIPFCSRIILIADTFDSMTSTRPYRKGLPYQVAFNELQEFSGIQFDPKIVEAFIKAVRQADRVAPDGTFELSIIGGKFKKQAA